MVLPRWRAAAHFRHAQLVYATYWWSPALLMLRLADHAEFVDLFYDTLEGRR